MRLVACRDAVARVHVRPASKETHGLFAGAFAQDDRRRAALADAPGADAGPRIAAIARARRDGRGGDGIGLVWRGRRLRDKLGQDGFDERRVYSRSLLVELANKRP